MAYLTRQQAAELLCISTSTLDRMVKRGVLPAYKIGPKIVRFDERDLTDYVRSHQAAPLARTKLAQPVRPCRYVPGMKVV